MLVTERSKDTFLDCVFLKNTRVFIDPKIGKGGRGPLGPPAHHYVIVYSNDGRVVEIENKDGKMTEVPSPYLLLFPGDYIYLLQQFIRTQKAGDFKLKRDGRVVGKCG